RGEARGHRAGGAAAAQAARQRSEEHTSELQSRQYLVCRLLLEKKKNSSVAPMLRSSDQGSLGGPRPALARRSARTTANSPSLAQHRRIFFFNDTATTEIYTLSLHDALPI